VRSCYIAMHVAEQMQLPAEQQIDLYYAMLLMDAGCCSARRPTATSDASDNAARRSAVRR